MSVRSGPLKRSADGDEVTIEVDHGGCRAASVMIRWRFFVAGRPGVTIRPPFEARAREAMARSISLASRLLSGVASAAGATAPLPE